MSGGIATLARAAGGGRLDVAAAARGIEVDDGSGGRDAVLGVDLAPLADHWLRGDDVVAVYEPADARRLRSTAMWRSLGLHAGVAAWEVVVSAQTAVLEIDVTVAVRSDVAADSVRWAGVGAATPWRTLAADEPLPVHAGSILACRRDSCCLIAVHPADARSITVEREAGRAAIICRLFAAPLEKGVLLRSRVLAAIGPAATADAWTDRAVRVFAASPPPLTT